MNRHERRRIYWLLTHTRRDPKSKNKNPWIDRLRIPRSAQSYQITVNTSPRKLARFLLAA